MASASVHAASDVWDNGAGDNNWQSVTNWVINTSIPGLTTNVYTSLDDATFSTTGAGGTINLGNQINLRTLIFGVSGGDAASFTIGDANDILNFTTAGGVTINTGVTTNQTIGTTGMVINLSNSAAAATTFTNNGTGLLTIAGNIAAPVASGNGLLTVGGTGNTLISGSITKPGAGSNALLKIGAGTLTLSNGSVWSGAGAIGRQVATTAGFPLVIREGILLLNGGTHTITGEAVIGGVVADGGAGNNAKLQIDAGTLAVTSWMSVGRGNGVGGVSSDLVANNNAIITSANLSGGFNGGGATNLVKGSITLNGTSTYTVTGNDANFNWGESAGSNMLLTLAGSSTLIHNGAASGTKIGMAGTGVLNNSSSTSTVNVRNLIIGQAANGVGAVYNKGTILGMSDGYFMGDGSGAYSYVRNDNGSAAVANATVANLVVGINANTNGVVDNLSGTVSATAISVGRFGTVTNANNAQFNVSGGTLASGSGGVFVAETTRTNKWANFNVTGSGIFSNSSSVNLSVNNDATNTGILSVKGGGTVTADIITTGGTNTNTFINLDNGTLQASSGTNASLVASAIDRITIYSGGGKFDSNGFSKSIDATITGPVADGITTFGVTSISLSGTGTSYEGRPIVKITGGGGTGATAVADFDVTTGQVTGVTMTSAGSGYTSVPTVTILGGGGTALTATATNGAVSGGGITKLGAGSLTLTAANSYTGPTAVNVGKLYVNGSLAAASAVSVANGATLGGLGTVNGLTTVAAGGNIEAGQASTGKLTLTGGLTFSSNGNLNFGILSNYSASTGINAGALTLSGSAGAVSIVIASLGSATSGNTYTLLDYAGGSIGGAGYAGVTLAPLPSRGVGNLIDTGSQINLQLTGLDFLKWTGSAGTSWDTTNTSWKLNSNNNPTSYINTPGDSVVFDDSASPNTVVDISTADVTPTSMIFNNNTADYTLQGSKAITGVSSLVKNNGAALTISSANTYSGGTILNAGTLNLNNASAIGTGALTIAGGIIDNTSGAAVTLSTNNAQNWNGDFAFTGTKDLNLGTGAVIMSASRIVTTNGTSALTVGGVVSGTGFALTKNGNGTLVLGGVNTYTGGTTLNAGTLQLNQTTGAAAVGTLNLNGGTLVLNAPANNFGYAPTINQTADMTISKIGNFQINYTGTLTGTGNVLNVNTSATSRFYLNAAVSGINQINITSGAMGFDLNVGNRGGGAPVNVSTGASLWFANATNAIANNITLNGGTGQGATGALFQEGAGTPTISGNIALASGDSSIGGNTSTGNVTISGIISGTGALTKIGVNKYTLSGANTYTGSTTINAGTLAAGVASVANVSGAFGNNSALVFGNIAGAAIEITGFNTQVGSLAGGGALGGNVVLGAAALTIGADNTSPAAYAGAISGTGGSLIKTGTGTQTLAGASSFTGDLTINGGTVIANRSNNVLNPTNSALGNPQVARNITVNSNSTLNFAQGDTLGGANSVIPATLVINAGGVVTNTVGNFTSLGQVTLNGGTLTTTGGAVAGYQSYSLNGNVTVGGSTASTISVNGGNAFNGVHLGTNTTFDVADATASAAADLEVSAPLIDRNGTLGGTGGLTKTGVGTMNLTGTNTYAGLTTISNGSLNLSGNGSLSDSTAVQATSATSRFNISGITPSSETIGSLAGVAGSQVNLGNKELVAGGDNSSTTVASNILGTGGSFTKAGTGTTTLSGVNTFTGNTNLNAGTLLLASNTALPATATLNLSTGTTLNTGGFSASTGQLNVNGDAVLDLGSGSSSILTFADTGAWSGILNIWNYTGGAAWTASLGDKLTFTSQGTINLANVHFYSDNGTVEVGTGGAGFIAGNELVPVPEPGAVFAGLAILGAIGFRERRRRTA